MTITTPPGQPSIPTLDPQRQERRTPWFARVVAATVVAYVFSPIDLIPDFIPMLGNLNDVVLVPIILLLIPTLIVIFRTI